MMMKQQKREEVEVDEGERRGRELEGDGKDETLHNGDGVNAAASIKDPLGEMMAQPPALGESQKDAAYVRWG